MANYSVIYIAGYGRSGSTLLDIILGNNTYSHSCGELNTIFDEYLNNENCSCGLSYEECPTWSKFFSKINDKEKLKLYKKTIRTIDKRETIFNPWKKNVTNEDINLYKEINTKLFEAISNENTQFIVDSSKTAADGSFRPIALKKFADIDVQVIHIQRRVSDVIKSLKKGSNRAIQNKKDIRLSLLSQIGFSKENNYVKGSKMSIVNVLRGSIGYYLANRDAKNLKKYLGDDNYIKISFEELLDTPEKVLNSIENTLNINLSDSKEKVINKLPLFSGHAVAGNRMIQEKTIIFGAK